MKKKISLMLAAALTAGLALTGCGGSKTSDTTDNTAGAENESTAEVKGVDVDTTGYLVAALNADIQTADVYKRQPPGRWALACGPGTAHRK